MWLDDMNVSFLKTDISMVGLGTGYCRHLALGLYGRAMQSALSLAPLV
jgi:hypothetical protein